MGPILAALLLLPPSSVPQTLSAESIREQEATALTLKRIDSLIVPKVEFVQMDAREAIRWLFRRAVVGGTIAPDVQGTLTLRLYDIPWRAALENVTRQVDASYRIDHGFFEIVRREGDPPLPPPSEGPDVLALRAGYERIANAVGRGSRTGLATVLKGDWVIQKDEARLSGEKAVRDLVETTRNYPRFAFDGVVGQWGKNIGGFVVRVIYTRGAGESVAFRDDWESTPAGWMLASRRPDRPEMRRFEGVLLSEVLRTTFQDARVSWTVDPSLDRKVTVDLTGLPFETALQKLTRLTGATYRIEGGVYQIVPRN